MAKQVNIDHIKSLIEQIEFAHERGIKDEHSKKTLKELKAKLPKGKN